MEMGHAVTRGDKVDTLRVGDRTKCTVESGHEPAEPVGFSLAHVGEVDEVAARNDLHRAGSRGFRLAVLDEVVLIPSDPATDWRWLTRRLQ
jgi:hypothetical protein